MASGIRIRAKLKDGVAEVKCLMKHDMETGTRKDTKTGELIPRQIINNFKAEFNGQIVFETAIQPAVSSNPYIQFKVKMMESGEFKFTWTDDDGSVYTASKKIAVN